MFWCVLSGKQWSTILSASGLNRTVRVYSSSKNKAICWEIFAIRDVLILLFCFVFIDSDTCTLHIGPISTNNAIQEC